MLNPKLPSCVISKLRSGDFCRTRLWSCQFVPLPIRMLPFSRLAAFHTDIVLRSAALVIPGAEYEVAGAPERGAAFRPPRVRGLPDA